MDIKVATLEVEQILNELQNRVKTVVFDEWVVLRILEGEWELLTYRTPREDEFKTHFEEDVSSLKPLSPSLTEIGDFGFSMTGHGTKFDAFLHAGKNIFFLFNNTQKSGQEIMDDSSWETANTEFEKLEKLFIADPVEDA